MKTNRILTFALAVCLAAGCNSFRKPADNPVQDLQTSFFTLVQDPEAGFGDIHEVAVPYAELLTEIAGKYTERDSRLYAQNIASVALDRVAALEGRIMTEADSKLYGEMISAFAAARSQWNMGTLDGRDHITHELAFASYAGTGEEVNDFFYIDYMLPTKTLPDVMLAVRFPDAAAGEAMVLFSRLVNGEENFEDRAGYSLGEFQQLDMPGAPASNFCFCNQEVVDMMLDYDIMYIMYRSDKEPQGDYTGYDTATVFLQGFHEAFRRISK